VTAKKGENVGAGCGSMSLEHSRWGMNNGWELEHAVELGERELDALAGWNMDSGACTGAWRTEAEVENASGSMRGRPQTARRRTPAGCGSQMWELESEAEGMRWRQQMLQISN